MGKDQIRNLCNVVDLSSRIQNPKFFFPDIRVNTRPPKPELSVNSTRDGKAKKYFLREMPCGIHYNVCYRISIIRKRSNNLKAKKN